MTNPHIGSSLDDFLLDEGIYEEVKTTALTEVLNWLAEEMENQNLAKSDLAAKMGTSRSQLDRLLNHDVTDIKLSTMVKAAGALGKRVEISLVDK